jgi:adenosylcobyric acid synthase
VVGTHIHGLFWDDRQRASWLARLGAEPSAIGYDALVENILNCFAAHLASHIDVDRLLTQAK